MSKNQLASSTAVFQEITNTYWLLRLVVKVSGGKWLRIILFCSLVFSVFPIMCATASWLDGTWFLKTVNEGRGLFEHYGTWSQLLACPVLLILALLVCQRASRAIEHFEVDDGETKKEILAAFTRRTWAHKMLFFLLMFIGLFALILNAQNTRQPIEVYGQEVWDSWSYSLGYVTGRLFLGFEWVYFFPLVGYLLLVTIFGLFSLVQVLMNSEDPPFSPYAPDGCGGYRPLGQAVLAVIYVNIPVAVIILAHIYTHNHFYTTLAVAILMFVLLVVAEALLPFIRLHRFLAQKKEDYLRDLELQISAAIQKLPNILVKDSAPSSAWPSSLTAFSVLANTEMYRRTEKMHTWPYLPQDTLKWLLPLFPLLSAYANHFLAS